MRRFSEGPDFGLTMINHNLAELLAEAKRPASVAASGRDKRITMRLSRDGPLLLGLTGLMTLAAFAANMAPLTQEASTAHYRLELQIGPTEKMFTPAEAAAQHPTTGEVMLGDVSIVGMPMAMMSMASGEIRHLEVHVISLDKGQIVTDAKVAIAVTGADSKKVEDVSVAKMYGVKEGPSDTHYGNNVSLHPGNYTVEITVNGEKAEFAVVIPAS